MVVIHVEQDAKTVKINDKEDNEDKLGYIQCICDQRHNCSGRQQKECRAKHNRAVKRSHFVINPRIKPHQQKPDDEIL